MSTPKHHYIDNKQFYEELRAYILECREAEDKENPIPPVPNHIGEKILTIATNLSYKPNFINYTFKEEMIGDAVENCIRYIRNFNPEKYDNAFSYVTTICFQAFVRRIQKEDKQFKAKVRYVHNMGVEGLISDVQDHDSDENFGNGFMEYIQEFYEHKLTDDPKKKKKAKKTSKVDLTKFTDKGSEQE